MNAQTKKETSTTPTKAQVEVCEKGDCSQPSSPRLYHTEEGLSTPRAEKICNLPGERYCARCGKWFWRRTSEYPFGVYCSDTCKRLSEKPAKPKKESRAVKMYTREGGYIMTYKTAEDAAWDVGLKSPESIRKCCRGEVRTSAGFIWKWKEEA